MYKLRIRIWYTTQKLNMRKIINNIIIFTSYITSLPKWDVSISSRFSMQISTRLCKTKSVNETAQILHNYLKNVAVWGKEQTSSSPLSTKSSCLHAMGFFFPLSEDSIFSSKTLVNSDASFWNDVKKYIHKTTQYKAHLKNKIKRQKLIACMLQKEGIDELRNVISSWLR